MMQDELIGSARSIANAWLDAAGVRPQAPPLAQTPRDEYPLEGGAKLYRFVGARPAPSRSIARPILLVPSLINRWYVLDLRPGASLVEALVGAGFDVWCLDWGVPQAEDRYLDWDAVLRRLGRAARRVQHETAQPAIGILGYCMGGTLLLPYLARRAQERMARGEEMDVRKVALMAAPVKFDDGESGHKAMRDVIRKSLDFDLMAELFRFYYDNH